MTNTISDADALKYSSEPFLSINGGAYGREQLVYAYNKVLRGKNLTYDDYLLAASWVLHPLNGHNPLHLPGILAHLMQSCVNAQPQAQGDDRRILEVIDERDLAEHAFSQAYYLITGKSPEWSNHFGYAEAIEEINDAQKLLRASVKRHAQPQAQGERLCPICNGNGCPECNSTGKLPDRRKKQGECRAEFEKYYGAPLKDHDKKAFTMNQHVAWSAWQAAWKASRKGV